MKGQLAFVVSFAALGAASLWYWGAPSGEHVQRAIESKKAEEFEERFAPVQDSETSEALLYIAAVMEDDCEGVIERTEWMQARMKQLQALEETEATLQVKRERFCEAMFSREEDGFRIAPEGVDDPYLFFPGVEYEFLGMDEGRDDLDAPVASRAWIALRFPSPSRCLKDETGRAISGLIVGLNLTPEGRVVKAGVLGNAEIQWDSVRYSW